MTPHDQAVELLAGLVKPLVWNESKAPVAQSCVGVYLMSHDFDGWYWILTQQGQIVDMAAKPVHELSLAQAAAQADYTAHILAAISIPDEDAMLKAAAIVIVNRWNKDISNGIINGPGKFLRILRTLAGDLPFKEIE